MNRQQIYGGGWYNTTAPNPQGQTGTGTATTSKGGTTSGVVAGTLGWWLAIVAGLVAIRVIYEVKGKVD